MGLGIADDVSEARLAIPILAASVHATLAEPTHYTHEITLSVVV